MACFVLGWPAKEDLGLISGQGTENNVFSLALSACCINTRVSGAGEWCLAVPWGEAGGKELLGVG